MIPGNLALSHLYEAVVINKDASAIVCNVPTNDTRSNGGPYVSASPPIVNTAAIFCCYVPQDYVLKKGESARGTIVDTTTVCGSVFRNSAADKGKFAFIHVHNAAARC